MVYKNCQFDSLSPLFLSCQAAGQPTTLWRSTDKHKVQRKNPPIPVLTWLSANHVLRSVSESLHLLQFDNHSRFIMWPKCGEKKKSSYVCHLMHEWNLDLIGPHATTDCVSSRSSEKKTALRRQPCWKENTSADASNTGRLCWCPILSEWTHKNKQGVQKCELLPVYYITFYRLREIFLIWRDKHPKTGKNIDYAVRQLGRQRA